MTELFQLIQANPNETAYLLAGLATLVIVSAFSKIGK